MHSWYERHLLEYNTCAPRSRQTSRSNGMRCSGSTRLPRLCIVAERLFEKICLMFYASNQLLAQYHSSPLLTEVVEVTHLLKGIELDMSQSGKTTTSSRRESQAQRPPKTQPGAATISKSRWSPPTSEDEGPPTSEDEGGCFPCLTKV